MAIAWLERKRARRGWAGLFVAAAIAVGLLAADYDFGSSYPDESLTDAIALQGDGWDFYCVDVPAVWANLEASHVYERIREQVPELRPRLDAAMRRATGIRWTPVRWNLWFGRPLKVSGTGSEAVITVSETLLLRGGLMAATAFGIGHVKNGVFEMGGVYAVRKDSLLLIGTSSEVMMHAPENDNELSYFTGTPIGFGYKAHGVAVSVNRSGEWNFSVPLGVVQHKVPLREEYFSMEWPQRPIISITTRGLEPDAIVPRDEWPEFPGSADLKKAWDDFEKLLPVNWREGADTTQFALFDVDTSETVPVPDAAVFARSETVLGPLTPPSNAIPYEWSGAAGWMTPWLGEGMNLFVAADDRSRVFANQEATMARVMGQRRQGRIASDDARVDIDAGRLAQVLTDLVRRAAKDELLPGRNAEDVEADVVPWLKAFGALGELRFSGRYDADGLTLHGETSPPVEQESAR